MGKKTYNKGDMIHPADTQASTLEIVLAGSVRIYDSQRSIIVGAGGLLGALETPLSPYSYSYVAEEDTTLFDYPYTAKSDIERIISANPRIVPGMINSSMLTCLAAFKRYDELEREAAALYRFLTDTYTTYVDQCVRLKAPAASPSPLEQTGPFAPEDDVPDWKRQYYSALRSLSPQIQKAMYASSPAIGLGLVMSCISDTSRLLNLIGEACDYQTHLASLAISGEEGDFFDLFSNLLYVVSKNPFADTMPLEAAVSKLIIYMTDSPYADIGVLHSRVSSYRQTLKDIEESIMTEADVEVEKDAYEALHHSLQTILTYSGISPEDMEEFRDLVEHYSLLHDKNSTEDDARKLRRTITDRFYHIYEAAFFNSVHDFHIPAAVKMFFCFGYVDENLCGMSNAAILFDLIKNMESDPHRCVYTIYDWLMKIYKGEAEPSKNEFDMDYPAYLREQKNNGEITADEEKQLLKDVRSKVSFEISNFFSIGNRLTFGRITTFCPLLSEHNILRPLRSIFLTPTRVHELLDDIRKTDYSCFFREVMYSNRAVGVNQEFLHKEILPHFILMPNVGSKGALWQETAGIRRDTPGRIMLSIFPTENLDDIVMKLCAEFRWELCKKIQGMHWNDVTDPSLTSEYCDYMQFYKKNRELSSDAKEKIKLQLSRAKNNYRGAFVTDYMAWIKYESTGSPRLNKVARSILLKYVPFPAATFASMSSNPMYQELIDKRNTKLAQRKHTLNLLCQRIQSQGLDLPAEISAEVTYLNR